MFNLSDSVGVIPGVGTVVQGHLARLGIISLSDLLGWYPRTYIDASKPSLIRDAGLNQLVVLEVTIDSLQVKPLRNRRMSMVDVKASDDSGEITGRWFHQPYLQQKLIPESQWIWIGKIEQFRGERVIMSPLLEVAPRILSVYGQTKGVSSKMLRGYVDWVLENVDMTREVLPEVIREEHKLVKSTVLHTYLHQPTNLDEAEQAKSQVAFQEVFSFFARMVLSRKLSPQAKGIAITPQLPLIKVLIEDLPFELTPGQKRVIWDCLQEMEEGKPMTRLLSGDVGSGKTIVATLLAAVVAANGFQTVLVVPTEILAKQHTESIAKLLPHSGLKVAMWTAAQKDEVVDADIIIGTHAVLQSSFSLPRLGLLVVDEQHRFGVQQRQFLRNQNQLPHMLSMTATPIPRTLALALYGDLTVSFLRDKPKDRLPIITEIVTEEGRNRMYGVIESQIESGHQVFVLCSLIEKKPKQIEVGEGEQIVIFSAEDERKTVTAEVERLRKEYPHFGVIEAVHGKMKAGEKRAVMQKMAAGEVQVLVATSVIETGVDIQNATVMVVEGADRFGLAQLHQFRGRVGRGSVQSYCFLCPNDRGATIDRRLGILVESNDGFIIAETDLALRGPGELTGKMQSGLPDFKIASLSNTHFLLEIKELVEEYDRKNPGVLRDYLVVDKSDHSSALD